MVLLYLLQAVLVPPDGRLLLALDLMVAPQLVHFLFDGVEPLQPPSHRRQQRREVHPGPGHLGTHTSGQVTNRP